MIQPTHRLRAEERNLYKKVIKSIFIVVIIGIVFLYVFLPILIKFTLLLSSFKKDATISDNENFLLLPPILEAGYEATNTATISLTGWGEVESTVKIIVNGDEQIKILADKEGKFTANKIRLQDGANSIYAFTVKNGKESSPSSTYSVTYKSQKPTLEIETPDNDSKFTGENKELTIRGKTDSGVKVIINGRVVIVDNTGTFMHNVTLTEGDNVFKIEAYDNAGNVSFLEKKVTFAP